ncbi:MAG: IS1 family transposase [Moorea sp. SIO4G3]|nr:IS1 family transposase [Moorena sp. SIO4G3]
MECPNCHSSKTHKYGNQRGKQRYKCNECGRQFIEVKTERGYDEKTKLLCIKMYLSDAARSWGGSAVLGVPPMSDCRGFPHEGLHQDNGMGFRGIERVTGVHHTTIIGWVKKVSSRLEDVCFTLRNS